MPTVSSSAIRRVRYDEIYRHLYITFQSGGTYTHYRVPPEVYLGLISASSVGGYYHRNIKGRYRQ